MDSSVSDPLVFLHLLADRKGKFAALRLVVETGGDNALSTLTEEPDLLGLASLIPCLYYTEDNELLSAGLANSLAMNGCRSISQDQIGLADQLLHEAYADDIEWIDGAWYMSPPAKAVGNQAISRTLALQLVQLVAADGENREIEEVFRRDPALSYQLLRLVNSLAIGAGRHITSFSQAIMMLGRKQLRRWLNLMVFASREGDKRSTMLLAKVAIRARAMELLARAAGLDVSLQEQSFMVGMFSLLGVLFGLSLEEVLRPLDIGNVMRAAVLSREGQLGNLLAMLEMVERAEFSAVRSQLEAMQVSPTDFNLMLVQACNWTLGVVRDNSEGHHG